MAKSLYIGNADGVAKKVVKPYIGDANNIARKVKKGYIGDANNKARLCFACGTPIGQFAVGSVIKMNVNGAHREFIIVNHGIPSGSTLYDSSCNGTWLLMKDLYTKMAWDGTDNDYKNSNVHSYLNSTFLDLLDGSVQSSIKQVKLPYHNGVGNSGSVSSGSNGLLTKVFLLSYQEVNLSGGTVVTDGACLDYFNGASDSTRIAYYSGTATHWWLRSANHRSTTSIYITNNKGGSNSANYYSSYGIRPAFVMPFDALVNDEGMLS